MVVTLILLSQGRGEGVAMATPILLLGGRRQEDYGPLPHSLLGKWRSVQQSLARNGKGVAMAHALPLPEGRMEGDHDLSPCPLEKWRIVASALLN